MLGRARWCQVEKVSDFSGAVGGRPALLHDEASVWVCQRSQKAIELLLCFGHIRNIFRLRPKRKDFVWRAAWPNRPAPGAEFRHPRPSPAGSPLARSCRSPNTPDELAWKTASAVDSPHAWSTTPPPTHVGDDGSGSSQQRASSGKEPIAGSRGRGRSTPGTAMPARWPCSAGRLVWVAAPYWRVVGVRASHHRACCRSRWGGKRSGSVRRRRAYSSEVAERTRAVSSASRGSAPRSVRG
jgi:hypothetical protein